MIQPNATTQLHRVLIDIGPRAAEYTKPGQYVQVKADADGKPGFFAIASAPDANNQGVLELLIKNAGEAAEKLCALGAGTLTLCLLQAVLQGLAVVLADVADIMTPM